MEFKIIISTETLRKVKEFQEQTAGVFSDNPAQVIRQLFFLADMGSGWLEDLTDNIKVEEVSWSTQSTQNQEV